MILGVTKPAVEAVAVATLRDALLPKLVSGTGRVTDTAAFLEGSL